MTRAEKKVSSHTEETREGREEDEERSDEEVKGGKGTGR